MSNVIIKNTKLFVVAEAVEGTYDPASAGSEAVQPLADGLELTPARETLDRSILSGSIGYATPRNGMKSVSATIPCEFRAATTEGGVPDYHLLLKSALGDEASIDEVTSTTGHTVSSINMSAANASAYVMGDIVLVKESGAYHVSPISKVNATSIELLVHAASDFSDGVKIAKVQMYYAANSGHPSLTVERWFEDKRKEYGAGMKVTSMSLNNFTTGQLADLSFSLEGASYGQSIDTLSVTPTFATSLPPVILNACVFVDGSTIAVNELSLSVENTLGWITSTCSANGRISSRVTDRKITGSFNPYKQDDSVDFFSRFNNATSFSVFAYAYNPSGVTGEFNQVVAFYLPQVLISELGQADQDGVVQESISFTAHRGNSNSTDEIFIASI